MIAVVGLLLLGAALLVKASIEADRAEAGGEPASIFAANTPALVTRFASTASRSTVTEPQPTPAPVGVGAAFDRAPARAQETIRRHFLRRDWAAMAAIGECESGWDVRAHNSSGEDSRGPWQINVGPGANTDMLRFDLFTWNGNAQAARLILNRQGIRAWLSCARRNGLA